ncbi:MAG: bifunctional diaminohydroxyphosphoribosylaminopyrimidine deaminase/5-amino-6-(5-phosphoribosylamino)uracil reductase RibD [Candidatus Omnitrophica bacterium]|nr:bifunctional diaminohydroxyphosphoribosylaminopyrimidine deaminase/5-amino-6-(5-phosphoribosylamino)uracil reductase RibD [Candidatus Omnitrophota bacterium]
MKLIKDDSFFMSLAIKLALKGEGKTQANPMVGAIIVKNGRIISRGYHRRFGGPHAEIVAFKNNKKASKGATLYVNLEPCCHFGKTGPCVEAIISEGIKRVVIATPDPNPLVNGKSISFLRKKGINVTVGVLKDEAKRINEVFFKNMETGLPFVVTKTGQSLDGKTATRLGESKWITSSFSRELVKELRDKYRAVLVGVNTVIADDPTLEGFKTSPYKIIVDPDFRTPLNCKLLRNYSEKTIIVTAVGTKIKKTNFKGTIIQIKRNKSGDLSLRAVLAALYGEGITSIFVEGGSETLGKFFDSKLVDKSYFFIAPKILGGKTALASIGAIGVSQLKKAVVISNLNVENRGCDILVWGYPIFQ